MMDYYQFSQYLADKYDWIKFCLAHKASIYFWNGEEAIPIYSMDYVHLWWNALTYNETDNWDNEVVISGFTIRGKIGDVELEWKDSDSALEYFMEHLLK